MGKVSLILGIHSESLNSWGERELKSVFHVIMRYALLVPRISADLDVDFVSFPRARESLSEG